MGPDEKYERLLSLLRSCGSIAVAFSGGVDSSFLLKAAQEALGSKTLALTADSVFIPRSEVREAVAFCKGYGIRQVILPIDVLDVAGVRDNPPDRCYHCKRGIFERMLAAAAEEGISVVAEGSNLDDEGDYRPGMRAIRELGVYSPLRDAGLTKADIRELSRRLGLKTWDKPSYACLASRFAYGETLDTARLHAVENAENVLHGYGLRQCRVRVHGTLARIELMPEDFTKIMDEERRHEIVKRFKEFGFSYISLDLAGFRSGSMNELLK